MSTAGVPAASPTNAVTGAVSPPSSAPFDLVRLKSSYPDLAAYRSACLHLAKSCERGERYDDAARFVREIMRCTAQDGSEMTEEEKNVRAPAAHPAHAKHIDLHTDALAYASHRAV